MSAAEATAPRTAARGSDLWWGAAVAVLALKTLLMLLRVALPDVGATFSPRMTYTAGDWAIHVFLVSALVFLAMRWWFGVVSAVAYALYSSWGALSLVSGQHAAWGWFVVATNALVVALLLLSLASRPSRLRYH